MTLVLIIDTIAILWLAGTSFKKGFEATLPVAAFLMLLFPVESQITLPGLFDLTTQRIIVIVLILLYAFSGEAGSTNQEKKVLPFRHLIFLLMVWMLLSALQSVVLSISLKSVLSQFFDFFVVYYIFVKSISKVETVNKILFGFVAALFVLSIFGVVEIYWGWTVMDLFPQVFHRFANIGDVGDRGLRVQTTFGIPILFGAALALAIPLALYLVTLAKTTARKAFLWCAILLMFVNIYKTMSRGPWLAAILSLAVTLVCGGKQMRRYVVIIGLLAATALIVRPGIWETISNLYAETLDPDTAQGGSYQWRYALYQQAFLHLDGDARRALFGYGPESFYYLGWKGEFQGDIWPFESCDSSVAALMIETGYVGLLIVAVLLIGVGVSALRNFRKLPKPANFLCIVLFANIAAFCFLMTNVLLFGWGQQSYMLWIIMAITMTYPGIAASENPAIERLPAAEIPAGLAGSIRPPRALPS